MKTNKLRFLTLAVVMAGILLPTAAGSTEVAEKQKNRKIQKELRIIQEIDSLVRDHNFQFIPMELTLKNGNRMNLRRRQSARVLPRQLLVSMTGCGSLEGYFGRDTGFTRFDFMEDRWFIDIDLNQFTKVVTFQFVIDRKTAKTALRITDNRSHSALIYTGYIVPN